MEMEYHSNNNTCLYNVLFWLYIKPIFILSSIDSLIFEIWSGDKIPFVHVYTTDSDYS